MNILYTSKTPLAGVCELMARCVNQYLGEKGYHARVLNRGPGRHSWYTRPPGGLVPRHQINNDSHVDECLRWADVIHCMANVGVRSKWFARHDPLTLLKKKIWVFQWHGAQIWDFRAVLYPEDYEFVKFIHIGQGWIETQWDWFKPFFTKYNARVVPNLITADDPKHIPLQWGKRKDKIGYSPSQRQESAVNRKGIPITTEALVGFQRDLITGASFEECLARKQRCRLGIDEVVTPMYHRSGLEFLSQGTPCICSMAQKTIDVLKNVTGSDRNPFIQAGPNNLRDVVTWYWKDLSDGDRQMMGRDARSWIDEYYHPNTLIHRHVDVYEGK